MAKKFRILPGNSFRRDDGSLAVAGDEIELGDDVAATHAHRIETVVAADAVQTPAPAPSGAPAVVKPVKV